jgi:hypothetical protein
MALKNKADDASAGLERAMANQPDHVKILVANSLSILHVLMLPEPGEAQDRATYHQGFALGFILLLPTLLSTRDPEYEVSAFPYNVLSRYNQVSALEVCHPGGRFIRAAAPGFPTANDIANSSIIVNSSTISLRLPTATRGKGKHGHQFSTTNSFFSFS